MQNIYEYLTIKQMADRSISKPDIYRKAIKTIRIHIRIQRELPSDKPIMWVKHIEEDNKKRE